ncbi:MAG: helix-turn-helix transcriptional regulator [Sphingobacteriales bacterium]|nr:helix-turn-helix transcriptional regulator [Sphingobacteriales bacterium]
MSHGKIDFGEYLHQLRKEHKLSQKIVADKLGIDISMLSKIEHGERQVQSHMLKSVSELFDLNYRTLQIQFLNQRIEDEFGKEPFYKEAIAKLSKII